MVNQETFEKIVRQYGPTTVQEAISAHSRDPSGLYRVVERSPKGVRNVYRLLFERDLDCPTLWKKYQEVSEPATVPHQSPGARDTSRSGGDGVR